jgi:hypothetical protein
MILDADEIHAALFVVSRFVYARGHAGRPVPPSVRALHDRLKLSHGRHETSPATEESNVWIGTRLAAQWLGWHPRRVQRHRRDLDGQLVGGRLVFPARAVRAYANAQHDKGNAHD